MNHLSELQNSKQQHATKQAEKVNGNRSIRKRHDEREANPNEANPCKVNQIMYLPKYIPSTKKRKKTRPAKKGTKVRPLQQQRTLSRKNWTRKQGWTK